jgi:predicted hydrocarbon binding protein
VTVLQVPIDVDPETGAWSTDGLPMLYVPRHYFMNVLAAAEEAIGRAAFARQLYEAGYRSAFAWCDAEAATHGLCGMAVFHHYMKRLSQRGWGLFDGGGIDPETGCGEVRLRHSSFVCHAGQDAGRKVCYPCAGWFPGALDWVGRDTGQGFAVTAEETACAAEGAEACLFRVFPR